MPDDLTGLTPDEELSPPFISLQGADGGGYTRINVYVEGFAVGELEWFAGPSMALYGTGVHDKDVFDAADRLLEAAHDLTLALNRSGHNGRSEA